MTITRFIITAAIGAMCLGCQKQPEPMPIPAMTSPKMLSDEANPLIDFMFTADPTSVEKDGRLYVYGTNDHEQYLKSDKNGYEQIKSLVMISTDDMVNWTYHGTINVGEIAPYIVNSWAPSVEKKVGADGTEQYYLYFSNSGCGVGVLTAPTPTGPWTDPLGHPLISVDTPTLGDCPNPFDPGVVVDDNGTGWLAFGGGTCKTGNDAMPGTARIVQLGDDMISLASDIKEIPAPYFFEASELNHINGTWIYTLNTNWVPRDNWKLDAPVPSMCSMAYMTSTTPLDPNSWVYQHHYMPNPGETVEPYTNNHTHLVKFADKYYLLCHSMYLQDYFGTNGGFRNMCVEDIEVDESVPAIGMTHATRTGVAQVKPVLATETHPSSMVAATQNVNFVAGDEPGEMMVRSEDDRVGVYKVRGVLFDNEKAFVATTRGQGQIDVYADSIGGKTLTGITVKGSDDWRESRGRLNMPIDGLHDLFIVVGDGLMDIKNWRFE